jgi:hypothetical protein
MAKKSAAVAAPDGGGRMLKAQYVLRLDHVLALREEAAKRSEQAMLGGKTRSVLRPDASGVLREILDAWIAKAGKR